MAHGASHRHNSRNECIHLRLLLKSACRTLDEYYPEMLPSRVRDWWTVQKNAQLRARIAASEAGVADRALQVITMEEELRDGCC